MAWTSPRTWVALEVLSASLLNTHVRDNLLETMPAKVTTAGDIVYATGANTIARLGIGSAYSLLSVNAGGTAPTWGNGKLILKTSATTRNSTTTLADDPALVFPVLANEVWMLEAVTMFSSGSTPDFKASWQGPAGVTGTWQAHGNMGTGGVFGIDNSNLDDTYAGSANVDIAGSGGTTYQYADHVYWTVLVVNGANAGNVVFGWAQNTSDAGNTTVWEGSFIRGHKIS